MTMKKEITVLHIEDSSTDAAIVAELIGRYVDVHHCTKLVDAHEAGDADVILLDLLLPDSEGVETVRRCRAAFPSQPIVVMTHLDDAKIQAECMAAGADWYFRKGEPTAKTLLRAMDAAIHAQLTKTHRTEELEAARRYLKRTKDLLAEIETRITEVLE